MCQKLQIISIFIRFSKKVTSNIFSAACQKSQNLKPQVAAISRYVYKLLVTVMVYD